jgi:hypothetical protein
MDKISKFIDAHGGLEFTNCEKKNFKVFWCARRPRANQMRLEKI